MTHLCWEPEGSEVGTPIWAWREQGEQHMLTNEQIKGREVKGQWILTIQLTEVVLSVVVSRPVGERLFTPVTETRREFSRQPAPRAEQPDDTIWGREGQAAEKLAAAASRRPEKV
ncbi:hypothetical protein EYF80_029231 [Liparis tanakae]|uniref:Uncharacterized protein n=1 Tax=Liparis tanakae TaxID=230148 RepID=A0A4Z2H3T6_9TELE|nr:hypothetical protein EYF80_029231 [Liparis tanakae]